jgi:hypothetical protein
MTTATTIQIHGGVTLFFACTCISAIIKIFRLSIYYLKKHINYACRIEVCLAAIDEAAKALGKSLRRQKG